MSATQQHFYDGSSFAMRLAYSTREVQGITILIVVSCISLVAIIGLLLAISVSAFNTRGTENGHLFIRTHVAAYFVSLLLCDLLQVMGSLVNSRWVQKSGVEAGNMCVFQGVLKQSSDIGTALWTFVIAIHTFCLLFLELKMRAFVLWVTLIGGWSAIIALVILGPATLNIDKRGPFYGISGYWCWISPQYKIERITLDYMIMFLAAFISFVLYVLIFLRLRGNVVRSGWRIRFRRTNETGTANWRGRKFADDQAMAIARQMLIYPIAYTILVIPIATARFAAWAGHKIPFEVTIFTAAVFLLSGLINVVLFTMTRRILPAESLRIGSWSISRPHDIPPDEGNNATDPYYQTPQTKHSRNVSNASSEGSTVVGSEDDRSIAVKQARKARPADIIIRRESIESMYSVYDEVEEVPPPHVQRSALQPPLMSSVWSPDGSPQRR
ncbi:hypothetical protein BDZ94DRAFT_1211129 [Collybia nuda]|uniref:G protein-coupled receptor GPR1/2/3 C-terminal domain-containing protein n=1 Tax=Collybia nuda TaxID=64659 RepID=A0A9P5YF13_9AGAR|nr:hypothetical protein BDZ94DRAFT_1211129 [Collybia nuda]